MSLPCSRPTTIATGLIERWASTRPIRHARDWRRQLGAACTRYQSETLQNLSCKRLQCDEIWSYVGGKDRNLSAEKKEQGLGSIWTWTALDADSKLIVSWLIGSRDAGSAYEFMQDVAGRLRHRVQLTTDGHKPYLAALEDAFGADIDYAVLQKIYGAEATDEKRYSPAVCLGCDVKDITGSPSARQRKAGGPVRVAMQRPPL